MNVPTLLLSAVLVGIIVGYGCGGRLRRLGDFPGWFLVLPWVPVALQAGFTHLLEGSTTGHVFLLMASYALGAAVLAGLWLVVRHRERSLSLRLAIGVVVLGWAMNTAVMAVNGGMPVSRTALDRAGYSRHAEIAEIEHVRKHVLISSETSLAWLGDVIPVPSLRRVVSLGDVVMLVGIAGLVAAGMTARDPSAESGGAPPRPITLR